MTTRPDDRRPIPSRPAPPLAALYAILRPGPICPNWCTSGRSSRPPAGQKRLQEAPTGAPHTSISGDQQRLGCGEFRLLHQAETRQSAAIRMAAATRYGRRPDRSSYRATPSAIHVAAGNEFQRIGQHLFRAHVSQSPQDLAWHVGRVPLVNEGFLARMAIAPRQGLRSQSRLHHRVYGASDTAHFAPLPDQNQQDESPYDQRQGVEFQGASCYVFPVRRCAVDGG